MGQNDAPRAELVVLSLSLPAAPREPVVSDSRGRTAWTYLLAAKVTPSRSMPLPAPPPLALCPSRRRPLSLYAPPGAAPSRSMPLPAPPRLWSTSQVPRNEERTKIRPASESLARDLSPP
ncbi:hypothetical protein GLOTRDRAFT_129151 [Gloeophyllum trabeum ATCC 11539]|uniref:Uncharacterized protein n=1 Tax=Gloeophyllum trabeum (strain ATCC 11539 / FP-39264 / Madison 617) TaxID=670483 RepID=S7RNA9_GLOTA|nr:uncharacterized protein GLOTRDRAFT_129151 [Gloeophyllum trabeum ATCC 11539]EPQ55950.1 hypothetical protein GLOTRDRAFT_129151 [Gloeophyllum trabeum ATCC 11539]